ncbi:MAG TPA: hypothetical protein VE868_07785, partial [Balneolaceae bacterium]|nr:hypothetical protein [Balneolaceae bacterium]
MTLIRSPIFMRIQEIIKYIPLVAIISLVLPAAAMGQSDTTQTIPAVRIHGDLPLSGSLRDSLWSRARRVRLRYEVMPNDNRKALQATYAKVLYNKSTLYIGFICKDTHPGK